VSVHLLDLTATQQAAALIKGQLDAGLIGFADEADAAGPASGRPAAGGFVEQPGAPIVIPTCGRRW